MRTVAPTSALLLAGSCVLLAAQTAQQPSRSVTDPGVITTRQAITPAGVQTVFDGRVYGVVFGASADQIWALAATKESTPSL